MIKLAIVGSRSFNDYSLLSISIEQAIDLSQVECIISGGASGADKLAEQFAQEHGISTQVVLPDWKTYGRAAGIIRNKEIISSCDLCIAFWDGNSKGTKNDIDLCRRLGKECRVVMF